MASKLIDGDYRRDENGNAVTVEYVDELLQNAFVTLKVLSKQEFRQQNKGKRRASQGGIRICLCRSGA